MKVGIIGYGVVGKAIGAYYTSRDIPVIIYDKYCAIGTIDEIIDTYICYICVPTPNNADGIDLTEVDNVFMSLSGYSGEIVLKSTVIPGTTDMFINKYSALNISFCPEFLSAKTNIQDYAEQKNIILGIGIGKGIGSNIIKDWYTNNYPHAELSIVSCIEAESVKIYSNVFYAVKIQTFTEFYLACQHNGSNFDKIRDLMLKNNWINPMHTTVPCNGAISFSGMCFPKDIASFNKYLENNGLDNRVINAAMTESLIHNSTSFRHA
jgi:UDP-glucose 6-dehydrogenase